MAISYYLVENNLTTEPGDYYARVQHTGSINDAEFVQHMLDENTDLDRSEIENVLILHKKVKRKLLVLGLSCQPGWGPATIHLRCVPTYKTQKHCAWAAWLSR